MLIAQILNFSHMMIVVLCQFWRQFTKELISQDFICCNKLHFPVDEYRNYSTAFSGRLGVLPLSIVFKAVDVLLKLMRSANDSEGLPAWCRSHVLECAKLS